MTEVVSWIINVVTKSGNAPFRHFELNVGSELKQNSRLFTGQIRQDSNHVFLNPTSRLTSNRGRLLRMVDQNGGKFQRLLKIIKNSFYANRKFFFEKANWVL